MHRSLSLASTLLLLTAVGCGEATVPPDKAYYPENLQGTVNKSLPRDLQEKQEAVAAVLGYLLEDGTFESLPEDVPEARFKESLEEFLEGTLNLARWDFDGDPTGDDVPVVLYFNKDSTGENQVEVKRVYTVSGSPGRYTIRRKS